jgi:hypothetical protein
MLSAKVTGMEMKMTGKAAVFLMLRVKVTLLGCVFFPFYHLFLTVYLSSAPCAKPKHTGDTEPFTCIRTVSQ